MFIDKVTVLEVVSSGFPVRHILKPILLGHRNSVHLDKHISAAMQSWVMVRSTPTDPTDPVRLVLVVARCSLMSSMKADYTPVGSLNQLDSVLHTQAQKLSTVQQAVVYVVVLFTTYATGKIARSKFAPVAV